MDDREQMAKRKGKRGTRRPEASISMSACSNGHSLPRWTDPPGQPLVVHWSRSEQLSSEQNQTRDRRGAGPRERTQPMHGRSDGARGTGRGREASLGKGVWERRRWLPWQRCLFFDRGGRWQHRRRRRWVLRVRIVGKRCVYLWSFSCFPPFFLANFDVWFRCALQIGYSSPSQLGIMRDLHLSLAEVFSCPVNDASSWWHI